MAVREESGGLPYHKNKPDVTMNGMIRHQTSYKIKKFIASCSLGFILLLVLLLSFTFNDPRVPASLDNFTPQLAKRLEAAKVAILQDFQVYPPVLTPKSKGLELTNGPDGYTKKISKNSKGCVVEQTLMKHTFANSYNNPFVGTYNPPGCNFNRVTFNFTVRSAGRQFDRLGIVYFGNTELWRTSTAEPTQDGIEWTYIKDMSNYLALFKESQKIIFDLGNEITDVYTAPYHTTLKASFFQSEDTVDPADKIFTISADMASKNQPSVFQYPPMNPESELTLPQNTRKAVVTMSTTGQINEEFWFGNVLDSDEDTFGKGVLLPHSPFREAQLYIDGKMAGVAWPFPIIFTGGVVPGLWRPIVGIDAFDLKEDEIDITPWLPMLCDGKPHKFQILIAGIENHSKKPRISNKIGSYWLITGKVFTWLDHGHHKTTGSGFNRNIGDPNIKLSSHVGKLKNGTNHTLTYSVDVTRSLSISSLVKTAEGSKHVSWTQDLSYSNHGDFTDFGNVQFTKQMTQGTDKSSENYSRKIKYPVTVNTTYHQNPKTNALSISATISRGQNIDIHGQPVFPSGLQSFEALGAVSRGPKYKGTSLQTTQSGNAQYHASGNNKKAESSGMTTQDLTFSGFEGHNNDAPASNKEFYARHVVAVNGTVTHDRQQLIGSSSRSGRPSQVAGVAYKDYAWAPLQKLLGRGPGNQ